MPRANRYYLPGHVWHITHRCHQQAYLLKFVRDRKRWLHWLFEAKKRYGLCILNYIVTSNHIHLLVKDTQEQTIARSLQLVASRTAQEYNQRKQRKGAYWEDRHHATAVSTDEHLLKCLVYIDLNRVRAGVVNHPMEWKQSGYREIQCPPSRYRLIDINALLEVTGIEDVVSLQIRHRQWVEDALSTASERDASWTDSIAVGDKAYLNYVQQLLGVRAMSREIQSAWDKYSLKEASAAYDVHNADKKVVLSHDNRVFWGII